MNPPPNSDPTAGDVLGCYFRDVEWYQYALHREAARRAAALADAVGYARRHPEIYALPGDSDPVDTAERCAVLEAAARFQMSENTVRNLASTADRARAELPALWERAWEGFASLAQVETAIALLPRFDGHPAEALAAFDRALADLAPESAPGVFRSRARRWAERLAPVDAVEEHRQACTKRTVHLETDEAGMAWIHLLTETNQARAIFRRLTSTAKNMQRRSRDARTRDQLRADLASGWLRGVGTPTAVKTKVFVTVPADILAPAARATVRRDLPVPDSAPNLNEAPRLDTGEVIDAATAVRLLLEAGSFTRVITDPVTGVVLDLDRTSRVATRQQREWLLMIHGTCTRDGCSRHAAESDIDHWDAYHGPRRGPTDIDNLHPFCGPENQLKERSRFRYRRRRDGTVQLTSPTGFATRPPAMPRPGEREARDLLTRIRLERTPVGDDPPF